MNNKKVILTAMILLSIFIGIFIVIKMRTKNSFSEYTKLQSDIVYKANEYGKENSIQIPTTNKYDSVTGDDEIDERIAAISNQYNIIFDNIDAEYEDTLLHSYVYVCIFHDKDNLYEYTIKRLSDGAIIVQNTNTEEIEIN